jgi:hypothetical protein
MRAALSKDFVLLVYQRDACSVRFSVHGSMAYQPPWLSVHFAVHGPVDDLMIPYTKQSPERQHHLWEHMCFEVFFAPVARAQYWEINVSPSGNWNTYRFDHYRQGMHVEPLLHVSQIASHVHPGDALTLHFQMDVSRLVRAHTLDQYDLECSPCCILVDRAQHKSYWAMDHQLPRPDFHRRASFVLLLPIGNRYATRS